MTRRALPIIGIALGAVLLPIAATPTAMAAEVINCYRVRPFHDLNGDGYRDAVVGDPYASVDGKAEAGTVTVLFGDADGRIGEGARRVLTQADFGQTPEVGDHFGWTVNIDRTDSGGCDGILIGAPGEDIDGKANAGMAHIVTLNGALPDDPQRDVFVTYDQSDVGGTVEAGDEFGYSVASQGGSDEYEVVFAFGAPGENNDAGVVNRIGRGPAVQERQGSRGVPGTFQAGDRFGETIGFFNYLPTEEDDDWYLYVGVPGDTVAGKKGAGSVTAVSRWSPQRLITQNTSGVPGTAETGDHFGASFAVSQFPPTATFNQLAIGAPDEDLGSAKDAGSVTVFKRTFDNPYPTISITQSTTGVAGTAEAGDRFGAAVAYRDDRTLAIGIPGEDLGSVANAGSVQVVRVGKSNLSFPLPSITEAAENTPGSVQANSRFGSSIAGVPGRDGGEAIFAISSPFQAGGSVYVISSDTTVAPRGWQPGTGNIPGTGVRFGQSVS